MEPLTITIIMLAIFFLFLFSGMSIFSALGSASVVGILLLQGPRGLGAIPGVLFDRLNSFTLVAVPLFILMGEIIFISGLGTDLFNAASSWMSRIRGGLAMASVVSSAIFGALCGVSVAGAATIGSFAIPEMMKRGYHKSLATGPVAAAGALSLLIPPSIAFVLYGEVADESVGKLFIGGIVPGAVLACMMIIYIGVSCIIRPELAPDSHEKVNWIDRIKVLKSVWASLLLVFLVLGFIYLGISTPTESAAIGCIGSAIIAFTRQKLNNLASLKIVLSRTIQTTGMILMIFSSALLFGYVLTLLQAPQTMIHLVESTNLPTWATLSLIMIVLITMGMFLDVVSVILIATPLLLPMVVTMGYNPLWFGIIVGITCEMAVITPPVGLNLYVVKGVSPPQISLNDIIKSAIPFVFVEVICLIVFVAFPDLALWLPNKMG
ncbi:MAG: TRAP transporter large permease [Desulfuromonadales bacterium]|nr:TRAP transporter large permease [Desulfuromonadales bacterium]MBN2792534.1 TRAP transporter large permease [Desulfuromonadales bacterium]